MFVPRRLNNDLLEKQKMQSCITEEETAIAPEYSFILKDNKNLHISFPKIQKKKEEDLNILTRFSQRLKVNNLLDPASEEQRLIIKKQTIAKMEKRRMERKVLNGNREFGELTRTLTQGGYIYKLEKIKKESPSKRLRYSKPRQIEAKKIREERCREHLKTAKLFMHQQESVFQVSTVLCNRFVFHSLIGKGGFNEVWKVYDVHKQAWYAAKLFHTKDKYMSEYKLHKKLNHKNIIKVESDIVFGDREYAGFRIMLMALQECSLSDLIAKEGIIEENRAKQIIQEVIDGVIYLESQNILHGDLKPANILLNSNGQVFITDFGLSQYYASEGQGRGGTLHYMAPECGSKNQPTMISSKIDVWAIGIIYFQMLYGYLPFRMDDTKTEKLDNIVIPQLDRISENSIRFLKSVLVVDVEKRLSITECLELIKIT